ncbi:class I SAM-dependent methyltransferase [Desulfocicer niacini]
MQRIENAVSELDFWEHIQDYDREINSIFTGKNNLTQLFEAILDPSEKNVADFGCGPGNALKYFCNFKQVNAIDFSSNMLAQAKANNHNQKNIRYFKQNIKQIHLLEKMDVSISINSIFPSTYKEFDDFFANILFNTKKGGTIFLLLPSFESYTFHLQMLEVKRSTEESDAECVARDLALIFKTYNYSPLGFILSDLNRVQKKWLKEEVVFRLSFYSLEHVSVKKMMYHTGNADCLNHKRWYWLVSIIT